MARHRHTSPTNFTIQQSRSFEGFCVPLRLMNCLFPVPDSQSTATEFFQSPLYRSWTVFCSISHLLRHFPSSALAWRRTSLNSVTRNYCCRAREVTLSFMDTLIALTDLPLYRHFRQMFLLLCMMLILLLCSPCHYAVVNHIYFIVLYRYSIQKVSYMWKPYISILIVVGTCTRPCVAAKAALRAKARPRPCEPAVKPRAALPRII